jgi:hypothetical protein
MGKNHRSLFADAPLNISHPFHNRDLSEWSIGRTPKSRDPNWKLPDVSDDKMQSKERMFDPDRSESTADMTYSEASESMSDADFSLESVSPRSSLTSSGCCRKGLDSWLQERPRLSVHLEMSNERDSSSDESDVVAEHGSYASRDSELDQSNPSLPEQP